MKVFIGADHRGYYLKEQVKQWLLSLGHEVLDKGNEKYDPDDDFPDYALAVAEEVAKGKGVGILFCGSGGMALAANKVKGIRAVEVYDEERARHAKSHDNANVIAIPADVVRGEQVEGIVQAWLGAKQKTEKKYKRRLEKIKKSEQKYFK